MAELKGWQDFRLSDGTSPYPLESVRESWSMVQQSQRRATIELRRRVYTLQYHTECNTKSTTSSSFAAYMLQDEVLDPVLKIPARWNEVTGSLATGFAVSSSMVMAPVTHSLPGGAAWKVKTITVQDQGDGNSRVTTTLEYVAGDWA